MVQQAKKRTYGDETSDWHDKSCCDEIELGMSIAAVSDEQRIVR